MYEFFAKTVSGISSFMYSYLLIILLLAVGLTYPLCSASHSGRVHKACQ